MNLNNTSSSNLKYGLSLAAITAIQTVFKKYPSVVRAILYGSRAKGNYKTASDIDLTLVGDMLDYSELIAIDNELDDLLLPYKIDLSLYNCIDNVELIKHIDHVGVEFYAPPYN